jgi:hypothetical protein
VKDLANAVKHLEESESTTMDRIAAAEAVLHTLESADLADWIEQTTSYVSEISNVLDAGKEMKRLKTGWLTASSQKEEPRSEA